MRVWGRGQAPRRDTSDSVWRRARLIASLLVLGTPRSANADDAAPIDFVLEYSAADGCPNDAAFENALRARLPASRRLARHETTEQTWRLEVRLPAAGGREHAQISGSLPGAASFQRQVPNVACEDAMQSMAVIAAMALESSQRRARGAPASSALAMPSSVLARAGPITAAVVEPRRPPRTAPPPRLSTWQTLTALSGVVEGGMAPDPAPGASLALELRRTSTEGLSPAVRLSASYAQSLLARVDSAQVRFRLLATRLELCPARVDQSGWGVTGCVALEAGQLRGSAEHVDKPRDQSMLWLGVGLSWRAERAVSRAWAIEMGASARALPIHDRFIFSPARLAHEVPVIAGDSYLGLRYTWP